MDDEEVRRRMDSENDGGHEEEEEEALDVVRAESPDGDPGRVRGRGDSSSDSRETELFQSVE